MSRSDPAVALSDALAANAADERRRGLRALLLRPVLTAGDPAFVLVRRQQTALRDWLARETGWTLHVDAEVARLAKAPADNDDGTRPARSPSGGAPFSRRRYVLLCLALAALERADAQTTLGRVAEDVVAAAADPGLASAGVRFAMDNREERGDLVAVVRLLLDLGVLRRVAGDEATFAAGSGDVLYDVERRVLAGLLVARRGPSTVAASGLGERLAAITEEFVADSDEARNRALRQRLTRRLIDDPIVYYDELDDAERAYLTGQRAALLRRIEEATGLVPEVRAEGIAMVDPAGELTDFGVPEEGTDGHATLLLAEHLATQAAIHPDGAVPESELRAFMAELVTRHAAIWRKAVREPGASDGLCAQAVERLVALRLARRTPEGVRGLPALARFAVAEPTLLGAP